MGENECALHTLVLLYAPVKTARNIAVCFEDVESKSSKRWWNFTFWGDIQRHRAKLARLAVLRAEVDRRIVAMRKEQSEKAGVSTLTQIMDRSLWLWLWLTVTVNDQKNDKSINIDSVKLQWSMNEWLGISWNHWNGLMLKYGQSLHSKSGMRYLLSDEFLQLAAQRTCKSDLS